MRENPGALFNANSLGRDKGTGLFGPSYVSKSIRSITTFHATRMDSNIYSDFTGRRRRSGPFGSARWSENKANRIKAEDSDEQHVVLLLCKLTTRAPAYRLHLKKKSHKQPPSFACPLRAVLTTSKFISLN